MSSTTNTKRARTEDLVHVPNEGYIMLPDFNAEQCNPYNSIRDYNNSPNTYPVETKRAQALRFALNVTEFELDIVALVHMVGLTCQCLDDDFQWVQMKNNNILQDTALTCTKLTLEQIQKYSTEPEIVEYYNKKMIRFTMCILTNEFFIGGYLFNWLRNTSPRQSIRSSPNIGLYSTEIAWFTFTTMFTINQEIFNTFLEEEVFDRKCQYHSFEKKFNLRNNGEYCDWTKGWCLEVPEHEADYATERVFRRLPNGTSIWSRFAPSVIPVPLQLDRNQANQFNVFSAQKRWYMRGFSKIWITFNNKPPTTDDIKLITFITKEKHPENDKVFIVKTAAPFHYRYLITCWQVDDKTVRDLLDAFIKGNTIKANVSRPGRRQQVRTQWASIDTQSIISDIDTSSVASSVTNIPSYAVSSTPSSSPYAASVSHTPSRSSLSVASASTSALKNNSPLKHSSNESSIRDIVRDEIRDPLQKVNTQISSLKKNFSNMQKNSDLLQKYQETIKEKQNRLNISMQQRQNNVESNTSSNNKKIKRVADTFNKLVHEHNTWSKKLADPMAQEDDLSFVQPPQYHAIDFDNLDGSDTSMAETSDSDESKSATKSPSAEGNEEHD